MEVIDVSEGGEVVIEVGPVVCNVGLAEGSRDGGVGEEGSLDVCQSGVEVVVALGGEEEVVVGVLLEGEGEVAVGEGVEEVGSGDDGDEEQLNVDGLVEVHQFEPLLLREGRTVDLLRVLHLLVHVDLPVRVLHVQRQQELLRLRGELLDLYLRDVQEDLEDLDAFFVDLVDDDQHDGCEQRHEHQSSHQHQYLHLDEAADLIAYLPLPHHRLLHHHFLYRLAVPLQVLDGGRGGSFEGGDEVGRSLSLGHVAVDADGGGDEGE
jgi:hypothetical protein